MNLDIKNDPTRKENYKMFSVNELQNLLNIYASKLIELREVITNKSYVLKKYKQKVLPNVEAIHKWSKIVFNNGGENGKMLIRLFKQTYIDKYKKIRNDFRKKQRKLREIKAVINMIADEITSRK